MKQFSRFVAVGLFNTLLGYGIIFSGMFLLGLSPELSNILGYVIGLLFSYLLNRNYTFAKKVKEDHEFVRFLMVFAFAYSANFIVLYVLIHFLNTDQSLSQIISGLVYICLSYALNKYYVFRARSHA